jgi:uncharacterized membrane protein YozB (DUF420 family)
MDISVLPSINATLNFCAAILLTFGFINIKRKNRDTHKKFMLAALFVSFLFLTSYLIYHAQAGSTPYPYHNWTRPFYFGILIPHIILAAAQTPFILAMVWFALGGRFDRHKRIARIIWPVWMFVSLSGVIVYFMLYHF